MRKWEIIEGKHPETKDGEMFLTNATKDDFQRIGWKSKRMGNIAYDVNGNSIDPINALFPVFVQKQEYDYGMKSIST